jgi:hypothetical protein
MADGAACTFALGADILRPLIAEVVREVLAVMERDRQSLDDGRLAYSEQEAAQLLGLAKHQLRDERLLGRIKASVGPCKRILYSRQDLLAYLESRRWEAGK